MHYLGTDYPPELSAASWRKSSRSGGGNNCVEVAPAATGIAVRDSKDRPGPAFLFDRRSWSAFLGEVRDGRLDRS